VYIVHDYVLDMFNVLDCIRLFIVLIRLY